jgi:hypothetical protein
LLSTPGRDGRPFHQPVHLHNSAGLHYPVLSHSVGPVEVKRALAVGCDGTGGYDLHAQVGRPDDTMLGDGFRPARYRQVGLSRRQQPAGPGTNGSAGGTPTSCSSSSTSPASRPSAPQSRRWVADNAGSLRDTSPSWRGLWPRSCTRSPAVPIFCTPELRSD